MSFREEFADPDDDDGVVDGVVDAVARRGVPAGQSDFEIELYGLGRLLFPRVDADAGLDPEFGDEDGVHGFERMARPDRPPARDAHSASARIAAILGEKP